MTTATRRRGRPSAVADAVRKDAARIVARRAAGERPEEIADEYGASAEFIRKVLREQGYVSPARRARRNRASVRRRARAGEPLSAIARTYGCSTHVINEIVASGPVGPSLAEKRALSTEELRRAYEESGGDRHAVAERFGWSAGAVARRLGVVEPRGRPAISMAEIRRRYEAGQTLSEVALAAGVAETTIARRLGAQGVEIRTGDAAIPERRKAGVLRRFEGAVCVLYQAGVPTTLLAEVFETSTTTVQDRMAKNGIKSRRIPGSRPTPAERRVMERLCAEVRAGRLVVEAGRLVPAALDPHTLTIATGGDS